MPTPLELRDADDTKWAVYADELLSKGDPRGELIHLQQGARQPGLVERERALLKQHERLGGPGQLLGALDATWRHGFLSRVRSPTTAALKSVLTHPSGQLLDELVLDNPSLALSDLTELVGLSQHPALRSLVITTDEGEFRYENEIPLGNVLTLPALERLQVHAREVSLIARAQRVSRLRRLELSARRIPMEHLGAWTFPVLTELELIPFPRWTRRFEEQAWDTPMNWPTLEFPARFASAELAPLLQTCTLSSWNVPNLAANQLLQCLERCPSLSRIDLRLSRVDGAARSKLEPAGPRVLLPG